MKTKSTNEMIRADLRLLKIEESRIAALKSSIQEGIDSGIAHDFDPDDHLELLKSKQGLKERYYLNNISSKLERAENSGFTNDSKEQILSESNSLLDE